MFKKSEMLCRIVKSVKIKNKTLRVEFFLGSADFTSEWASCGMRICQYTDLWFEDQAHFEYKL